MVKSTGLSIGTADNVVKLPASDKPAKTGKPGTAWNDPKIPGLRLRYMETKAVWYLFYRTKLKKQRNMKIGDERFFTLTAARERAKIILARVANGEDPAADVAKLKSRATVQMLKEWHLERHAEAKNKSSWREDIESMYDNHVIPHLGADMAVADITTAHIADLHHKMRATPHMANRVASMLSKALNLSEDWGWRERNTNPVRVERYKEPKRKRLPEAAEAVRLLIAMNNMREENPWFVGLVELLCFTGARLNEIMAAKRAWVKPDGLHLPDSKTGEKIVPLSQIAREAIGAIPRVKGNPYLIVGHKAGSHLVNPSKPWKRLMEKAFIKNLRRHDLRRFFASAGITSGLTLSQIGELLGHMEESTTKRYTYLLTGAAQIAADQASERVQTIMQGDGKVTPFARKR